MPGQTGLAGLVADMLSDGEWHKLTDVMAAASRTIPPGKAVRTVERLRVNAARREGRDTDKPRTKPLSTDALVRSGQRALARQCMTNLLARGQVELDRPHTRDIWRDPATRVRLRDAGLVSLGDMAAMLGVTTSCLQGHVGRNREALAELLVDRPKGTRTPASAVEQWATYLARQGKHARKPQRLWWQPLNADSDALWNPGEGDWERVDGRLVTRPASRRLPEDEATVSPLVTASG